MTQTAINAQELRLGNWVTVNINPYQVDLTGLKCQLEMKGNSFFEPIPLTPELLEKVGFEYDANGDHYIERINKHFSLKKEEGLWVFYIVMADNEYFGICKIDNLHHLQNFYFALTGKELEIKDITG